MQDILMLLPVAAPGLFWAAYHYHKDRLLPEPPLNLAICFGLGLAAAGVSQASYLALEPLGLRQDAVALGIDDPAGLLIYAMLAIGPIEEFAKLLPFLLVVLRFRALDEPLDGIVYASFIALGYAAVENYRYLEFLNAAQGIARGFAGPVVHILFASIWGYGITTALLEHKSVLKAAATGFLLAAGLHGLYDFLVLLAPGSALPVAAVLIVGIWVWRLRLMHRLHDEAARGAGTPGPDD